VAIIGGLAFILLGWTPIGKGLLLGTIFSIINFVLMGEVLPLKVGRSTKKTLLMSLGSLLFRYVLLALPLYLAIRLTQVNLFSTVLGIFMVQLMILADHLLAHIGSSNE
jgi:hypothetical protein